jgi:hypothetical protein
MAEFPPGESVSSAQLGSLGGGNAVRLAPPVALRLLAIDISSGMEVALPDGVLEHAYLVSLPILAEPNGPDESFAWLLEVREDGHFLGYMRHPYVFDPQANAQVFDLPGHVLQTSAVLPVMLKSSFVQAFLPDVRGWSSPFMTAEDFGALGPLWSAYRVLAPQVGGRIGVAIPESGDLIWVDASGVGPAAPPPLAP